MNLSRWKLLSLLFLVKGVDGRVTPDRDSESYLSLQERQRYQDIPFPVCMLLFGMDDDHGYHTWLMFPLTPGDRASTSSTFSLQTTSDAPLEWRSLDDYSINQLIATVNTWYDARQHPAA